MSNKKAIHKIFDEIEEQDCKITNKEILGNGYTRFTFAGGFFIDFPDGTSDKTAIKKARKSI